MASVDPAAVDAAARHELEEHLFAALRDGEREVRAAAAEAVRLHGPGDRQREFVVSLRDPERKVRWQVVLFFERSPGLLLEEDAGLLLEILADMELPPQPRADALAVLHAAHEHRSADKPPPAYDPWRPPDEQQGSIDDWRDWVRSVFR